MLLKVYLIFISKTPLNQLYALRGLEATYLKNISAIITAWIIKPNPIVTILSISF